MRDAIIEILTDHDAASLFAATGIRMAFVFGSVAHGTATGTSDLDLALYFERGFTAMERLHLAGELARSLAKRLPMRVDAVVLNDAGPVLSHEAVIRGQVVHASHPDEIVEYEGRVRARFEDLRHIQGFYTAEMRERLGLPA
ncbi:MAG: nucleotidyltransferase domain-containing protein [Planctomycetes bacterium]|nr:nucleotidyltransferase domain-containing protein [Planctomycetota bacterium]